MESTEIMPGRFTKRQNGIEVTIYSDEEMWEFYDEYEDVYLSGGLDICDTGYGHPVVEGYDGCYDLPDEVKQYLVEIGYELDL